MPVRALDLEPRVLRALAAQDPRRYPLLLDSAAQGPLGRLSLLLAAPQGALWLDARGRLGAEGRVPPGVLAGENFLDALERWWRAERTEAQAPFGAEWSGG